MLGSGDASTAKSEPLCYKHIHFLSIARESDIGVDTMSCQTRGDAANRYLFSRIVTRTEYVVGFGGGGEFTREQTTCLNPTVTFNMTVILVGRPPDEDSQDV